MEVVNGSVEGILRDVQRLACRVCLSNPCCAGVDKWYGYLLNARRAECIWVSPAAAGTYLRTYLHLLLTYQPTHPSTYTLQYVCPSYAYVPDADWPIKRVGTQIITAQRFIHHSR